MHLDGIHIRMVDLLRKNGRLSIAALAKQLDISRSNAYQRYESLVDAGVITGFTATLDFQAAGVGVAALVFVNIDQRQWEQFRSQLETVAELEYFAVTTGQHDGMLLVRAPHVAAIHQLVATNLSRWPSVKSTETVFLMDEQWDRVEIAPSLANAESSRVEATRTDGMTRFIRTRAPFPGIPQTPEPEDPREQQGEREPQVPQGPRDPRASAGSGGELAPPADPE